MRWGGEPLLHPSVGSEDGALWWAQWSCLLTLDPFPSSSL